MRSRCGCEILASCSLVDIFLVYYKGKSDFMMNYYNLLNQLTLIDFLNIIFILHYHHHLNLWAIIIM
jgi:hypothetical protein